MVGPEGARQPLELGDLRIKLDQMTERISSRLKDRSRFPLNETVYIPGGVAVENESSMSYFEYAIQGLEEYHGQLGRWKDKNQHPVLGLNLPLSIVERDVIETDLPDIQVDVKDNLISFYKGLMKKYCAPGDDPSSYGETVYIDADLIELINERINIGRFVAEVKGRQDPTIYQLETDDEILAKLRDRLREEALVEKVRASAEIYHYNPSMAEDAFRWMIEQTISIEVAYIRQAKPPQE